MKISEVLIKFIDSCFTRGLSPATIDNYRRMVGFFIDFIGDVDIVLVTDKSILSYTDLKYLLIPEMHKDGAWHLHGLLKGIPWDDLNKFLPGIHPKKLVQGGYRYHVGITNKFGFNSFGKLRNRDAAAAYCLKYCGKGFGLQDLDSGTHLYFASHGLNKPVKITDGISTSLLTKPSFQNCYCAISWVKADEVNRIIPYLI